jgi:DNA polymerase III delta subunit
MVHKKQEDLSRYIQENTEKLHLLTILEEEMHQLEKLLRIQESKVVSLSIKLL